MRDTIRGGEDTRYVSVKLLGGPLVALHGDPPPRHGASHRRQAGHASAGGQREVHSCPLPAITLGKNMEQPVPVEHKKRGRTATGRDPAIGVRMPEAEIAIVDQWAERNGCTRSEAVRRLVALGLKVKGKRGTR